MEEDRADLFVDLLFEKYEEKMKALWDARRRRYDAELKTTEFKEEMEFLNHQIRVAQEREARGKKLLEENNHVTER